MQIRKWLFSSAEINSPLANAGLTVLRVFTGLSLAFAHGIGKVPPSEQFIQGVAELGFPAAGFFAWAAGISEFFGSILLAAGLLTRPSALFVLITMVVAAFIRHAPDPFNVMEKALLYGFIALAFLLIGSGKYGLDAMIRGKQGGSVE